MRASVARSLSDRPVTKETIVQATNEEILPVIRRQREILNYELVEKSELESRGEGVYEEIWRSAEVPTNCGIMAGALICGSNEDGTVSCGIVSHCTFNSALGVLAKIGVQSGVADATTSHVLLDAQWEVDATDRQIYLTVCDGAYAALKWVAVTKVITLER